MNCNDYRNAMDHIVPAPALKERILHHSAWGKRHGSPRRIFAGALAAVLTLACLFTAALAASPEFHTAVWSFFHITEREQMPVQSDPPSGVMIHQTEIGALVQAQYIKLDRHYGLSNGLLNDLTWSEDRRTLLDARFWAVKDNELVPVPVDMQSSSIDITFRNIRYQGNLYWFVHNGTLSLLKGEPCDADTRPEDEWYVESIPGRTDAVRIKLAQGRQSSYSEYPMIYYLDTGETEDILSGTGADKLTGAYAYDWQEDMHRVLITCGDGLENIQTWLCDLDRKSLVNLADLVEPDAQCIGIAAEDTLILTTHTTSDEDGTWQTVTGYAYDLPSGTLRKTLNETPCYQWWDENPSGAMLYGPCCVQVSLDGSIQIIDLATGEKTAVEGFTFQKEGKFSPCPQGNKLLYFVTDRSTEGLGITQLGVLDLDAHTFIAFDREGYEMLYEEAIGWNDANTVSIHARTPDGQTRYLILYQF